MDSFHKNTWYQKSDDTHQRIQSRKSSPKYKNPQETLLILMKALIHHLIAQNSLNDIVYFQLSQIRIRLIFL